MNLPQELDQENAQRRSERLAARDPVFAWFTGFVEELRNLLTALSGVVMVVAIIVLPCLAIASLITWLRS